MKARVFYSLGGADYLAHALSEYRLKHISTCRTDDAKRQSAAAELLLRKALSERGIHTLPEIVREGNSKPRFKHHSLDFSISHTIGAAAAVCGRLVGVDCERVKPISHIMCFFMSDSEREEYSTADDLTLIALWTAKEAYVKAIGTGLIHMRECIVEGGTARCRSYPVLKITQLATEKHVFSCAAEQEAEFVLTSV